ESWHHASDGQGFLSLHYSGISRGQFWKETTMALMRELWSDPSFLELTKKTSATGVADAAGAQPTAQTRDDTTLKAQVMTRLAALAGPYKEAVASNGADAQQLQDLFGSIKTAAGKRQYDEAA